jgi:HEAT repeat protein
LGIIIAAGLLAGGGWVSSARAEPRSELDALLVEAVRYGDTADKRAAKEAAREALRARMPEALDAAMDWVHGDQVMVQVLVMEWVTTLPAETVVPVMVGRLGDDRVETRRIAAFFLGFHDAPEHAGLLLPLLDDAETRGAALRTLGKWRVGEARGAMERWLREGTERVRVVAANALRDVGDAAALPALLAALDDPVFTVRHVAARAVVSMGAAAVEALAEDPEGISPRAAALRERCRADLGLVPPPVAVDGNFF